MARRISDIWGWLRLIMRSRGPAPTTRLVLYAHSRYMNRDGTRCRVGLRRLADEIGLNKSTVAQHRAAAIKRGWLIP